MDDPPSPWCFREFMKLDSLHEAKRGSAFGCQLFSADTSTLGILSDIPEIAAKLALGWPSYSAVGNSMVHTGSNPNRCSCALPHTVHDSINFLAVPYHRSSLSHRLQDP